MTSGIVRWGILSTANIATKVCRALDRAANATPLAVASRSAERAREWAREHGVERSYGSYEELLRDPEIDAVYIGLPPSMHHEWTIKAAEAKKHVLCEKPLALNLWQAEEMAQACIRNGVNLMDGVMWVHHIRTPQMRGHLESGELGDLRRITSAFCFRWDELPRDNIRLNRELGGGCLGDLGWYCVRATWWALGVLPERVFATARFVNDVTFNLSATMWFPEHRMASFDCGFDIVMRQWLEIAGTKKNLVCDDFVLPWNTAQSRYWLHDGQGGNATFVVGDCTQEMRMIEHFSQHVQSGQHNTHWIAEALTTQRICDALEESARSGRIVHL